MAKVDELRERHMRSVARFYLLVFALYSSSGGVKGWCTPPRSVFDEVASLYSGGKVDEARKRINDYVEYYLALGERGSMTTSREARDRVSCMGAAAGMLALGFENDKGRYLPVALIEASQRVYRALDRTVEDARQFLDRTVEDGREWGEMEERARQTIEVAEGEKKRLLLSEILALIDGGQRDRAQRLADEYSTFLREHGVAVEAVLSPPPPGAEGAKESDRKEEVVGPGVALPIVQLLLAYYRALAGEDPEGIDMCLCKGGMMRTGKEIVERLDAERKKRGEFDVLGPVSFDAETTLTIRPLEAGSYAVIVARVLKSARKDGKEITRRQDDYFTVRVVAGEYRLAFMQGRSKREEVK